jgi:hypothetical protein
MKKDLVVKNFKCGNEVKDITLSISPITFLVGPDERKKLEIMRSSDEKLGFKMINELPPYEGLFIEEDEKNFIDFWTEKFDINGDRSEAECKLWCIITNIAYNRGSRIILDQPGCGLYPAKQSLLADMFYDAYKKLGVWFIINTNSEYLIRKSQVLVKKMEFASIKEAEENSPFTTYCVPMDGKPYSLGYRHDGIFKEEFVTGFYDEASNQAFEIL